MTLPNVGTSSRMAENKDQNSVLSRILPLKVGKLICGRLLLLVLPTVVDRVPAVTAIGVEEVKKVWSHSPACEYVQLGSSPVQ